MKKILALLAVILIVINLVIIYGSDGTTDIYVVMNWTKVFFNYGFWTGFTWNSTYPHLLNLIFYFAGILSKFLHRGIFGDPVNIMILKGIALGGFIGTTILLYKSSINKKFFIQLIAVLFLINPAVVLNVSVLAYMDAFYVFCLILSLFLLYKIDQKGNHQGLLMVLLWITMAVGSFLKWQFLIYLPVLTCLSFCLAIKNGLLKSVFWGTLIGIIIVFSPTVKSLKPAEVVTKVGAIRLSYYRITHELFVTADFGNFWQLVQYYRYNNLSLTSSPVDVLSHIKERTPNWKDLQFEEKARNLFFSVFAIFLLTVTLKVKRIKKLSIPDLAIAMVLWTNFIYVLFNPAVHENHFIPSVALSAFIFVRYPGIRTFLLYSFLTLINFSNLSYFYGLSVKGLYGINYHLDIFGLNISILVAISLLVFFIYQYVRLLKTNESLLGWK